jgi:hypothetical protein
MQMISFIEKFLSNYSIDIVPQKNESGKCLNWSIIVYMQSIRRQVVLLYCCAVLEPDVVPLHRRFRSHQDWEWWVSILIDNGEYAVHQKTNCLTVLLWSAWARCCAPLAPILFTRRSRVVIVYTDREWYICRQSEDKLFYRVVVHCFSQMLCPFITDPVSTKIESGECLHWSIMVNMQSIRRQVVLPCCCAVLEPDVVPLYHRYGSPKDWEWWVSKLIDNGVYAVHQKTSCLTVLLCSAWAKYCAPSAPILLLSRSRVVSVYIGR